MSSNRFGDVGFFISLVMLSMEAIVEPSEVHGEHWTRMAYWTVMLAVTTALSFKKQ